MFYGCSSLISLPDMSDWNLENANSINTIFDGCLSLISLPKLFFFEQFALKNCFSCLNQSKGSVIKQKYKYLSLFP